MYLASKYNDSRKQKPPSMMICRHVLWSMLNRKAIHKWTLWQLAGLASSSWNYVSYLPCNGCRFHRKASKWFCGLGL